MRWPWRWFWPATDTSLHRAVKRWPDGSPRPRITQDRATTAELLKALKAGKQAKP